MSSCRGKKPAGCSKRAPVVVVLKPSARAAPRASGFEEAFDRLTTPFEARKPRGSPRIQWRLESSPVCLTFYYITEPLKEQVRLGSVGDSASQGWHRMANPASPADRGGAERRARLAATEGCAPIQVRLPRDACPNRPGEPSAPVPQCRRRCFPRSQRMEGVEAHVQDEAQDRADATSDEEPSGVPMRDLRGSASKGQGKMQQDVCGQKGHVVRFAQRVLAGVVRLHPEVVQGIHGQTRQVYSLLVGVGHIYR